MPSGWPSEAWSRKCFRKSSHSFLLASRVRWPPVPRFTGCRNTPRTPGQRAAGLGRGNHCERKTDSQQTEK